MNDHGTQPSKAKMEQIKLSIGSESRTERPAATTETRVSKQPTTESSSLAEKRAAKALVRALATAVIKENRDLWDEIKECIRDNSPRVSFGADLHMDVVLAAREALAEQGDPERQLLQNHLQRNQYVLEGWTPAFAISGEIFLRASRVAGRFK